MLMRMRKNAYKLKRQLDDMMPLEKRKKRLSKCIGLGISEWKLDEIVSSLPDYETLSKKVVKSVYEAIQCAVKTEYLTLRDLLDYFCTWIGHKAIVETPNQVADEMIEWFEKVVYLVIPIL